jgi:replicative DNA helicase
VYDQNLLRGSKAIADKVDAGMIMIPVTAEDREKILPLCQKLGCELPTVKTSVYKNRRGRWKDILVWCKDNRATCKIEPMFVTDYRLELIQIEDYKITVIPKEDKEVVKASTQLKPKLQEKKEEKTNNKLFDF